MDDYDNAICCGCLCAGRRMLLIEEFSKKQCFLQIIGENSLDHPENIPIWLCWECDAHTARFIKFKKKVQISYEMLNEFAKQNLDVLQISQEPVLQIQILGNVDIPEQCDIPYEHKAEDTIVDIPDPSVDIPDTRVDILDTGVDIPDTSLDIQNADNKPFLADIVKTEGNISWEESFRKFSGVPKVLSVSLPTAEMELKAENDDASIYSEHGLSDSDKDSIELGKRSKKRSKIGEKSKQKRTKKQTDTAIYKEVKLSLEEIEAERIELRNKEQFTNAVFKCEHCILPFPNPDDLKDHMELKHELHAGKLKCPVCERSFASEVSFNYHKNKHKTRYSCKVCQERFSTRTKVTKHHDFYHTSRGYVCAACNIEFEYEEEFSKHKCGRPASSVTSPAFPCPQCDKCFRWATSLRKHAESHRISKGLRRKPYCDTCRKAFSNTANLQKHVKTSSKHQIELRLRKLNQDQPTEEKAKDTSSKIKDDIEMIKCTVNDAKSMYLCPQCDKKFQWKGNLRRHLLSHIARANGELKCVPCDRIFSSIATYKQHMRISRKHVDECDFKHICTACGKRFVNKDRLLDHVNWEHLKNYVHTCDVCKKRPVCRKVFKTNTSLYLHRQMVHRKHQPSHLCEQCGRAFLTHPKLRSHIAALHTAESPYKCATCGAGFNWQSCLSRHIRVLHREGGKPRRKRVE